MLSKDHKQPNDQNSRKQRSIFLKEKIRKSLQTMPQMAEDNGNTVEILMYKRRGPKGHFLASIRLTKPYDSFSLDLIEL